MSHICFNNVGHNLASPTTEIFDGTTYKTRVYFNVWNYRKDTVSLFAVVKFGEIVSLDVILK